MNGIPRRPVDPLAELLGELEERAMELAGLEKHQRDNEALMPYDPFGILRHHEEVRQKILAREPGYAQTVIGDVMVSFEAASFHGPVFANYPMSMGGLVVRTSDVIDQIILDVARGDGIASPFCFSRARVARIVNDYESYPETFVKLHRVARTLADYYLAEEAEGRDYVY